MTNMKTYEVTVEVLTPVFIGSGEQITKKEYAYDFKNRKIYVIDQVKLFQILRRENKLASYQHFLLDYKSRDLMEWFEQINMHKRIKEFTRYELTNPNIRIGKRNTDLQLFIKDAEGKPYIPGSSIKGLIRTSLIGSYYLDESEIRKDEFNKEAENYLSNLERIRPDKNTWRVQKQVSEILRKLESDADNDLFIRRYEGERDEKGKSIERDLSKYILVSDSQSISLSKLTIIQKFDLPYQGEDHSLPIYREALAPGTKFSFRLSLPDIIPFSNKSFPYDVDKVFSALQHKNHWDLDFDPEPWSGCSTVFRLGGGVGFENKTFFLSKFNEEWGNQLTREILTLLFPKHEHYKDEISPRVKKMTEFDDDFLPMGVCTASYREVRD